MPVVTEEQFKEVFEIARQHQASPEGQRDLDGVSAMLGLFSGELPDAVAPAVARHAAGEVKNIQDLLTARFRCAALRPGDFSREAFEALPGFQSLMLACQAANVAPRVSVLRRAEYVGATEDDKMTQSALVVIRIYPPQGYDQGYLDISKDEGMGMPQQNWTPRHLRITSGVSQGPLKLMKPIQFRSGGVA